MLDTIRIKSLRLMIEIAVAFSWLGRKRRQLHIEMKAITQKGHTIPIRQYSPEGHKRRPVILFLHGGGWVGFSTRTHDGLCRDLCSATGAIVISVEYRLAPEHPFPAGIEDCLTALDWVAEHIHTIHGDPGKVLVCGDSAGGNLAAVVAQQARQRHPGLLAGQILIYPVTDHYSSNWPSYTEKSKKGATLTTESMTELWDWYTGKSPIWQPEQTRHELATPLQADDLSNLPPALILLAENDVLHDDGAEYAKRLKAAGNKVEARFYPGEQHGFIGLKPTPSHQKAVEDMTGWFTQLPSR